MEKIIRQLYKRWNAEGIGAVAEEFFDPGIEYHDDEAWPGGGGHKGRAAVIARFQEVIDVLGIKSSVVERVVDAGEQVAWVIRACGISPAADVPTDHRWGYTGRIVEDKLVYFRAFYNPEHALEAVGLAE